MPLDEGIKRSVEWFRAWRVEHPEEEIAVVEDPDRTAGDIPHGFKQPAGAGASPPLLALFGPTASGKTAVAGVLRDRLGAEVISADSAALYRDLPIITAAPDYPAQLVGIVPLDRRRLGRRVPAAGRTPRSTRRRGRSLVGGTGLYFRAAVSALELPPPAEPGRRAHWQAEYDRLGSAAAHEELTRVDPAAAARVHANDRKRVVRALELAETGASLAPEHDRLWTEDLRVDDADRRARSAARGARRPDRSSERSRWPQQARRTRRAARGRASSPRPRARCSASSSSRRCPSTRPSRRWRSRRRRLARYQRKWLRRMPGVVTLACESVCGGGRR